MVEKIIINPNKVRGYGNIVSSKGANDFITYAGSISEGTDTVYGATEKIFTLEDTTLLIDGGTTNNHNDIWNNMNWFTRADDGTSVYNQNTGSSNLQRNTDYLSINGEDVAIDFELINSTYCRVQVERKDSGSQYLQCNYHNTSGKVHIEIKTTGTYFYLDNTLFSSNTTQLNQSTFRLFFLTEVNNTTNFKYKDLRIYYI